MRPGDPRRWILITREKGIADTPDAGARWSLDHLLVDQDAIPTLVEVKRGNNTEIRRTVVGQLLEYASYASQTWTAEELRRIFEDSNGDADERLAELLQSDENANVFWERVATNLAARRLRLLFVADRIPDELARVVEFLNEQMPRIEVLAVEIKQFRGESLVTLVPQIIGRTAATPGAAPVRRSKISLDEFFDRFPDESAADAAKRLIRAAEQAGAKIERGDQGVSVRVSCSFQRSPISVAWFFPSMERTYWSNFKGFTFGTSNWVKFPAEAQLVVDELHRLFEKDTFAVRVGRDSENSSQGWAIDPVIASQHIDILEERLTQTIIGLGRF